MADAQTVTGWRAFALGLQGFEVLEQLLDLHEKEKSVFMSLTSSVGYSGGKASW